MGQVTGVGSSAGDIRNDYINLLTTQLRHQNPLEPMSNDQMASQLAQLSQLEQVEQLNNTFDKVLAAEQVSGAAGLIGKRISFVPEGQNEQYNGVVERVEVQGDKVLLKVGGYSVELGDIQSISN